MKIYFNPQAFSLLDSSNSEIDYLDKEEQGGGYKIQLINLDRQVSKTVGISIKDITN